MIRLRKLDHIVLRTADADPLVAFYVNVLGCRVERQLDIGLIQLRAGDCLIDVVPVDGELGRRGGAPPAREGRNLDHFCFQVDDYDAQAILSTLRAHGIEAAPPATRYGADGFAESIYIADPDNNIVELRQALSEPNFEETAHEE